MKNEILDTPFQDSFDDFLEKGETIVWRGQPSYVDNYGNDESSDYSFIGGAVFVFSIYILLMLGMDNAGRVLLSIFSFFILLATSFMWNKKAKHNFQYAITQNQILFQIKEKWKKKNTVHSIPFSKIKDIIVVMTFDVERLKAERPDLQTQGEATSPLYTKEGVEKIGTIFIVPHQPKSINFETVDLLKNEKRHQPTLELLGDVDAIAKIIREGVRNRNTD